MFAMLLTLGLGPLSKPWRTSQMKKSLVAFAVLAASGAAMAQSSVTLFGVVDAAYAVGNGSLTDKTQLRNSGYNSSRLGFRGTEDLGGGMKASFWLEAGVNNDDGTGSASSALNQAQTAANVGTQGLTFNRRSTVSLESGMGELRLGRDYTPQFWSETAFDPFGTNGVGTNIAFGKGGLTGVRASNSIGYLSPSMGGVKLWIQTYMGENASTAAKIGNGNAFRISFDQGKFSAAIAGSETTTAAGVTNDTSNVAGSYDFGVAKVMAQSNKTKITGAADIKGSVIGALVPMAGGTFRISSSQTEQAGRKAELMAVGFVQPMSKRTDLYATYGRVSNSGGSTTALNGSTTAANASSTGYEFGVKHSF
jgi:predicted porin